MLSRDIETSSFQSFYLTPVHYTQIGKQFDRLSLSDFSIKKTVGTGSTARVHLAKSKANGHYYAIKAIDKKDLVSKRQVEHALNEKQILSSVSHSFLVNYWGSFQTSTHVFLVMDYIPGGELFHLIREKKKLTEEETKFYAAQVILAIEYLHNQSIVYRDLKPENILLDEQGYIKITDFGFAKKILEDRTWTLCGTPDYIAPEIIRSQGYTRAVDWWSLGVLVYEMMTGHSPFTAKNPIEQYQKILEGDVDYPQDMSPEARDLLENLLKTKPSERFGNLKNGVNDIKNHPWFKSVDFDAILARKTTPPHIPHIKHEGDTHYFASYEELPKTYDEIHQKDPYKGRFIDF
ncbi:kinase-like domain-containing protein [Gilbertella persicaria]|uniref:kinase-like domain-containing protein n=1 Tax=Gilbertella persicaria TaxID=101096 RepID=UPI00221F5C95|nr:kinase-like domain-containing protein [Gilbertella persicaria]KAI8091288.1 kinase-like domain-containing protein [Gilbertella persicaria]